MSPLPDAPRESWAILKNRFYAAPLAFFAAALLLTPVSAWVDGHEVFEEDPHAGGPGIFVGLVLIAGYQILLWRRQPPRAYGWGNLIMLSIVAAFCFLVSPMIFFSVLNADLGSEPVREITARVMTKEVTGEANHVHNCYVSFDSPWEAGETKKRRVDCPIDAIQPGISRIVLKVRRGRFGYDWIAGHTLLP